MDKKIIDKVVVVGMNNKQPWKAEVKIAKNKKEILSAAGSKYVLIPTKEILDVINQQHNKLAVVCLPCHVKVIRNLQKKGKYKNISKKIDLK